MDRHICAPYCNLPDSSISALKHSSQSMFVLDTATFVIPASAPRSVHHKADWLLTFCSLPIQGTSVERDLLAGAARAVHWPNVYKPQLQLCLRLHAAGWQWSGGFAVDTPGDLFVKIRHRSAPYSQPAAAAPVRKCGCNARMTEKTISSGRV